MNSNQILKIVEQYSRSSEAGYGEIKVVRIPNQKTVFVEQIGEFGEAIMMDKYNVDESTYWAGFSSRSQTLYISQAA